jgi:integrase/recombinase XerD
MPEIPAQLEDHLRNFARSLEVRAYSPATLRSYRLSLKLFLEYLTQIGIWDVREVDGELLKDYQLWLQRRNCVSWTVLTRLQAVRRFFDYLESSQVVLVNPCLELAQPKVPCRLPKVVLTVDEARRVIEVPDLESPAGLRNRAILEVFYSTGIRLGEMAALAVSDVDPRNGYLRVHRGKFAKDRVVPLGQSACQWLGRYLEELRSQWSPPARNEKALWLSSHPPHQMLKSQAIEVMVKGYGRRAGLSKPVNAHTWRHSCASHLVARGANLVYVQRLLGHSSLRTTQVYVHTTIPEIKAMHTQAHPRNQGSEL